MEEWIFGLFGVWMLLVFQKKTRLPTYWKQCWLPLLALVSFAGLTVFQLMPLDHSQKSILLSNEMRWNQFSLDPHATPQHLLKTLAYACLFILTLALVNTEKRIKMVPMTFFLSGLFQASYDALMTLTKLE